MFRRLLRLVVLAGIAAGVGALIRALTRTGDPLPAPATAPSAPWPPLRNDTPVESPAPAVTPEPGGVPVADEPAPADAAAWVEPGADGSCPPGHPIKAKMSSKIFHSPGQLNYDRTTPDRCYVDAEAAEADGLRAAKR